VRELDCIRRVPELIASLVALATPEDLLWKPAPDRWSVGEVLTHLVDVEKLNLGLRARRILEEDLPRLVDYDQPARDRDGYYRCGDALLALEAFREARRSSLARLDAVAPSDLARKGLHPAVGEVTLRQILSLWAFHDLSHLRQIAELLKARSFWDGIGSLQTYYSVHP
jgi:DinB superfamily